MQRLVRARDGGEAFEPRAEIVAKEAQDAADERQLETRWRRCLAESVQGCPNALEEGPAGFRLAWFQGFQWPGTEQIVAASFGGWAPGVEQHRAR